MGSEALIPQGNTELDFGDPGVRKAIRDVIQSKAISEFPRAFQRLVQIADSEDERTALTAIKILGEMGGFIRNKSQIDIKFKFDDFINEQSDHPLRDLFKVGRGPIIEAELEVDDDQD